MKIVKGISTFIIIGVLCSITSVKAEITTEEYNQLREMFSEARIAIMTDEEKEMFLDEDLIRSEQYFEVTETANGTYNYTAIDSENGKAIMEAGIANMENGISTFSSPTSHETSYKRIMILATPINSNTYSMLLYTQWLLTPSTQSYDVTAMRGDHATIVDGTQSGTQTYYKNGAYGYVNYSPNGTNIVKQSNGFGISMNLVNNASYYETDISATVTADDQYATVYGTYQHAVRDVTLDESKAYTISHNGYGKVVNFVTSVQDNYDRMQGVYVELSMAN